MKNWGTGGAVIAEKQVIKAANGLKVEGFVRHGVQRAIGDFERVGVKADAIIDALKKPLKICKIKVRQDGLRSQRFIGQYGEVVVNPDTGKIISINRTTSKKVSSLLKKHA